MIRAPACAGSRQFMMSEPSSLADAPRATITRRPGNGDTRAPVSRRGSRCRGRQSTTKIRNVVCAAMNRPRLSISASMSNNLLVLRRTAIKNVDLSALRGTQQRVYKPV